MPSPIYTPRINNNDDTVRLAAVLVDVGSRIRAGDPIIDVETDKATFTVESAMDGDVPHIGRLTATDVERAVAGRNDRKIETAPSKRWAASTIPGHIESLTPEERGMARTVTWHRDEGTAGYVELVHDPQPWEAYAAEIQKTRGLMMNPMLSLMAWRLAKLAAENPRINATICPGGAYLYNQVNLGFMVQVGRSLYLVVVRNAASKSDSEFVSELSELQRAAMKRTLQADQTTDATIAFTSMARWNVVRHIPVLVPQTSLIVAHSAKVNGISSLGASYDHRLLTGFDVAQVLQALSSPPV